MVTGRWFVSMRIAVMFACATWASGLLIGALFGYGRAKEEDAAYIREATLIVQEATAALRAFRQPQREDAIDL